MGDARDEASVALWAAVVVVALLLAYLLSFGPACWIASRAKVETEKIALVPYRPLIRAATTLRLRSAIRRYAEAGAADGWYLEAPRESKGPYFPPRL